jgi:hypothetical protein
MTLRRNDLDAAAGVDRGKVLRDLLAGLPAAVAGVRDPAAFSALAERVPRGAGIVVHRPTSSEDAAKGGQALLTLELAPPTTRPRRRRARARHARPRDAPSS